MDRELFEHHLTSRHGQGRAPAGAALGVAGTRLCGDVVRLSLALDDDGRRVGVVGWEAEACGATIASLSAVAELVEGMELLEVARLGAHDVAEQLGGLSAGKFHAAELVADALARALGTAVRSQAALPAPGDGARTLVAMSGGVDSAVVALLAGRDGGDAVAVTLELWADEENDGERSCCSAQAVRHARALAHRMGLPHFTLDLRAEFRAGVVTPFLDDHRAGLTPNPCIRCNGHVRLDAMLDFADRLGAATLATGHYARVEDGPEGPLLRAAVDAWKDQTYMLAALAPDSLARMRFPLGELTKPQVRELAAEAQLPVASKPDSQDLCFLAGTSRAAFLARHAGIAERPGRSSTAAGTCSAPTAAIRPTRWGSAEGSASPPRSRSTCCGPRPPPTASSPARAPSWRRPRSSCAAPASIATARASTASSCATAPSRCRRASSAPRPPAPTGGWRSRSTSRSTAPRPASSPACSTATS